MKFFQERDEKTSENKVLNDTSPLCKFVIKEHAAVAVLSPYFSQLVLFTFYETSSTKSYTPFIRNQTLISSLVLYVAGPFRLRTAVLQLPSPANRCRNRDRGILCREKVLPETSSHPVPPAIGSRSKRAETGKRRDVLGNWHSSKYARSLETEASR